MLSPAHVNCGEEWAIMACTWEQIINLKTRLTWWMDGCSAGGGDPLRPMPGGHTTQDRCKPHIVLMFAKSPESSIAVQSWNQSGSFWRSANHSDENSEHWLVKASEMWEFTRFLLLELLQMDSRALWRTRFAHFRHLIDGKAAVVHQPTGTETATDVPWQQLKK